MESYEEEVRALERRSVNGTRRPVFYGSSSIRLWTSLAEDFDPRVVNLGFGGSTLEACDYFFERLVPRVNPRSLLVYAGDNDLGDGASVQQVFGSFQSLADKVKQSLGEIAFGFVSIKPSPARFGIVEQIRELNEMVRRDIQSRAAGYYVDVFPVMVNGNGEPRHELFAEDGLHLNREGYRLWSSLLEPYRNRIFTE